MATGRGDSLGAALLDLYGAVSGRARPSYTAKSWHPQIKALTGTRAGRAAAERAGLAPSARTLLGWLAQTQTPNSENRRKIAEAYSLMRGSLVETSVRRQFVIKGRVTLGRDSRVRGERGVSPLRVDGSVGNWSRTKKAWDEGTLTAQDAELFFTVDVVEEDIGEVSEGSWLTAFNGDYYEVRI